MPARLITEAGETVPAACELVPGQPATLGRHRNNSVVLQDEHASRWHAILLDDLGRWVLSCIGAPVNGTRVDGKPISQPVALENGQLIEIGDTRIRFAGGGEPPGGSVPTPPETPLQADELFALCDFMARSVGEADARTVVHRALETVLQQTHAQVAGFLSLDAADPVPRLILPEKAAVDVRLSRTLTQRVQQEGKTVWLNGADQKVGIDSLAPFSDALCVPLGAGDGTLGALHVYRTGATFSERHRRFCEVLAGYLTNSLRFLRARRTLEAENLRLRGHAPPAEQLVGDSPALKQLRQVIARAAVRPTNVLIQGESGVGKELVALALHRQSPRHDGPLVVVNCAAIAATLPEAELFGHCKGAFTGADHDRPGLFQQADEGTLFLDEVGELPLDCQAKLLRVLEGKGFRPVGATAEVQVDVRVVAATNRDLEQQIKQGKFRQELYFRLHVIYILVPPLREHAEDIEALARHFLDRLSRELRRPLDITPAALRRLRKYSWPGNVRQLWAELESAVALGEKSLLDADDLRLPTDLAVAGAASLNLDDLEAWAIREALRKTKGNITQAARLLGVVRDTLTRKMKLKGISKEQK